MTKRKVVEVLELCVWAGLLVAAANMFTACAGDISADDEERVYEPTNPPSFKVVKVRKGQAICYILVNESSVAVHMECLPHE